MKNLSDYVLAHSLVDWAKANFLGKSLPNAGCGSLKPIGGFLRAIRESDVNLNTEYYIVKLKMRAGNNFNLTFYS